MFWMEYIECSEFLLAAHFLCAILCGESVKYSKWLCISQVGIADVHFP